MKPLLSASTRRRRRALLAPLLALALVLGACGDDTEDVAPDPEPQPEEPAEIEEADEVDEVADYSIELSLGHVLPPTDPTHLELENVAAAIAERTEGRVTIEVFHSSELGSNQDVTEQVLVGAEVITHMNPGDASQYGDPELSVLNGPFILADIDEMNAVLDSDLFAGWDQSLADESGLVSLAWNWFFGVRHIISNDGYPSPDDLQGVTIRLAPVPVWVATFETLPSSPTTLEWAEVYSALGQGVIDAAEGPLPTLEASSLHEVGDTITLTGHFFNMGGFGISQAVWDSIPAPDQAIILEEFAAGGERVTETLVALDAEVRERLEEEGVTFVDADIAAYQEAVAPFYEEGLEGWGDDLFERVRAAVGD